MKKLAGVICLVAVLGIFGFTASLLSGLNLTELAAFLKSDETPRNVVAATSHATTVRVTATDTSDLSDKLDVSDATEATAQHTAVPTATGPVPAAVVDPVQNHLHAYFRQLGVLPPAIVASAETVQEDPADTEVDETQGLGQSVVHLPLRVQFAATPGPIGFTPAQIRHAYGFDKFTSNGAGQKIAVVEAYGSPTIQKDLDQFCKNFGIPSTTLQIHYPMGQPHSIDSGWALETSLDVQWAHAIAPKATILVVVAKSDSLNSLLSAVDYAVKQGASQVSMSWGASEFAGQSALEYHFNQPNVTFVAASGDDGAGVQWPASSSRVTAVGGTTLYLGKSGEVASEIAWSGSGGGVSAFVDQPAYQLNYQATGKRTVPDVSYNADPTTGYPVYCSAFQRSGKGWFQIGGTSAGTPQWAALFALVNADRPAKLGNADSLLYSLGKASGLYYRDIIKGNNGAFSTSAGYDEVTGLGSPLADELVPALITR